ncbi:MAG: flavodoxin [Gammaproteobacteria bacterium]|nr:MAG: flavodoxin [Gammaproteobacteria bacterium]RLA50905.1 MAG: flavodoxin [Gammaproteobacteria bacterium]
MSNLLIIYHSQGDKTSRMAQAVYAGAKQESAVTVVLKRAFDAGLDDLLWANGLIFGTPENFGYMSGALKDFFDRTFYPAEDYQLNLPYGIFVSAGNDGSGAVREIDRIALGYPLRKIAEPIIIRGEPCSDDLEKCSELGLSIAAGMAMGIF